MGRYGSFQNLTYGNSTTDLVPEIGMGATVISWSDRHAYTVIAISPSGKTITIQQDNAIRTDGRGMTDAQSYRYEPDPKGGKLQVRKSKNGIWKALKTGRTVVLGMRQEYYDYTF